MTWITTNDNLASLARACKLRELKRRIQILAD